ncbi:AraC family transcriptional regulator [Aeoliella mucimassa]|uniref:Xylose operon regulatory protein n=1 Tax=Aeoliella mucimassa TaxID=2527972 RepID=A0A518AP91_9BACT|nr:XylR family transcriptional regulator [Aeoliella mucimassa]QDU56521.1 Xylose operon regulatory protein [Aeoliella mucimassa]
MLDKKNSHVVQIAVLVDIDDSWGRGIVEAVARYAVGVSWQLLIAPRDSQGRLRLPKGSQLDGMIVSMREQSMLAHVKQASIPTVNVSGMFLDEPWAGHVATDDTARAKMAMEHFRSRLLENFASYAPQIGRYSASREGEWCRILAEAGFECHRYAPRRNSSRTKWLDDRDRVASWLESLPKPVGVFAADPYPARQLVEVCSWKGIDVPGEVAVLSGDEDDLLCQSVTPEISSIELAYHRIGLESAKLLTRIMNSGKTPRKTRYIKPLSIRLRRSTDMMSINDPVVSECVKLIWQLPPDQVEVHKLVRMVHISRRSLEQRFQQALGRTPAREIRRMRLEKARQLLLSTTLSIASIADQCGFSSGPYLSRVFRHQFGVNPSDLRIGR